MKMIKNAIFISGVFLVVLFILNIIFSNTKPHPASYKLRILQFDQGWGYCIEKNGKPFIFQQFIPAIEGNLRFPDRKSALKTGNLALNKLRNNQLPVISKLDLIKLGVVEKDRNK
jgi:hypothetical protein